MKPKRSRRKWIHGKHKWGGNNRLELPPAIHPNDSYLPDLPRINGGKRRRKKSPTLPFELQKHPKVGRKKRLTVQNIMRRFEHSHSRRSGVKLADSPTQYSNYQFWETLRQLQENRP